ncbi:MAG: hypothetical protein AB9897_06700 [Anaerolineaceae bacterium]
MNIDIATTVKVIIILLGLGLLASLFFGYRSIRVGLHLQFFRKRQDLIVHGWRLVFLAVLIGVVALIISRFGEPVAYRYFPPSPTITGTPTITLTPTVTQTPKDTLTPTITETLQYTYTPQFPPEAQQTVQTPIGPDANAIFSPIQFSSQLSKDKVVTENITSFPASVSHLYGGFSYTQVDLGVQWTAVWILNGKPVHIETKAWNYPPGGYGYTDWDCSTGACVPGDYEVQIFVGSTFKSHGTFSITGNVELGTATPTPLLTPIIVKPTATPSPTSG